MIFSSCCYTYFPCNLVALCVMLQGDGEISSFIEFAEVCWAGWPFFECTSLCRSSSLKGNNIFVIGGKYFLCRTWTWDMDHEISWAETIA